MRRPSSCTPASPATSPAAIFVAGISAWYMLQAPAHGAGPPLVPHGGAVRRAVHRRRDHPGRRAGLRRRPGAADQAGRDGRPVEDRERRRCRSTWWPSRRRRQQTNYGQLQVPYALSLLVTHSLDGTVPGVDTAGAAGGASASATASRPWRRCRRSPANPDDADALAPVPMRTRRISATASWCSATPTDVDHGHRRPDRHRRARHHSAGGADLLVVPGRWW